jgi:hypothetical protein
MRLPIIMGVTALALGAALAAVPANAGGSPEGPAVTIHKHHQTRAKPLYNSMRQREQPSKPEAAVPGRNPNDGGMVK